MTQNPQAEETLTPPAEESPSESSPAPSASSLIGQGFNEEFQRFRGQPSDVDSSPADDGTPVDSDDEPEELLEPEDFDSVDTPSAEMDAEAEPVPEPDPEPIGEDQANEDEAAHRAEVAQKWGKALASNPKRISEVPRTLQADALQSALQSAVEYGAGRVAAEAETHLRDRERQAYEAGQEAARIAFQDEQDALALDTLAETEPEEFAKLVREADPRVVKYLNRKRQGNSTPAESGVDPRIEGAATELLNQAKAAGVADELPNILQANPGRYDRTPQGLANLRADVSALMQGQRPGDNSSPGATSAPPSPTASPEEQAAAARRAKAARARKALPKPDVGDGVGPAEAPLSNDVRELLGSGFASEIRKRR